jgi:hypothetical protein
VQLVAKARADIAEEPGPGLASGTVPFWRRICLASFNPLRAVSWQLVCMEGIQVRVGVPIVLYGGQTNYGKGVANLPHRSRRSGTRSPADRGRLPGFYHSSK